MARSLHPTTKPAPEKVSAAPASEGAAEAVSVAEPAALSAPPPIITGYAGPPISNAQGHAWDQLHGEQHKTSRGVLRTRPRGKIHVLNAMKLKPVNIDPPVIYGTPQQGRLLAAFKGTWDYAPDTYAYQWLQAPSTVIAGAIGVTYRPVAGDVGKQLIYQVTATNVYGSAMAASATTAAVAP